MRRLFLLIFIGFVAIIIGFAMHKDPGLIQIAYHGWHIVTSLWFGIALLIVAFLVGYFLLRLISGILNTKQALTSWHIKHKQNKAYALSESAQMALMDQHFHEAEKAIKLVLDYAPRHLNHWLLASTIANRQQQFQQRDSFISKASKIIPDKQFYLSLHQAALQVEAQQWEEAVALLKNLHEQQPKHKGVLLLLLQALETVEDWQGVKVILPTLKKLKLIDKATLARLQMS